MNYIKSPLFYMGNKYELLEQLISLFPIEINTLYDLFGGSGVISLNVDSKQTIYNEFNKNIYKLIKIFKEKNANDIIFKIEKILKILSYQN